MVGRVISILALIAAVALVGCATPSNDSTQTQLECTSLQLNPAVSRQIYDMVQATDTPTDIRIIDLPEDFLPETSSLSNCLAVALYKAMDVNVWFTASTICIERHSEE